MHLNINTNPISLAQLSNIWREDITVTIDALAKDKILIRLTTGKDADDWWMGTCQRAGLGDSVK